MIGWPMLFWIAINLPWIIIVAHRQKTKHTRELAKRQGVIDRQFRSGNKRDRIIFPGLRKWRE